MNPGECWLSLFDMGLFVQWFKAGKSKGEPEATAQIVNGFVGWVRNRALEHTRAIVFLDAPQLHKQRLPGAENYKRREHDEEIQEALRAAADGIRSLGFYIWGADGLEADDGLAACAIDAAGIGWNVRVFSEDKDLLRLLAHKRIRVYRRVPGGDKGPRRDVMAEECEAHFGVPLTRMTEYLALTDKVDGIDGVRGIGPEGARELIGAYQHILHAYADLGADGKPGAKVRKRVQTALVGKADALELSLRLAALSIEDARATLDSRWLEFPKAVDMSEPENVGGEQGQEFETEERAETAPDGSQTVVQEQVAVAPQRVSLEDVAQETEQRARAAKWLDSFDLGLEPRNMLDAWKLSGIAARAMVWNAREKKMVHMYAKKGNREALYMIISKGRELNLPAGLALSHINIVEGKAECDVAVMIGLALRSGRVRYVRYVETSDIRAVCETLHATDGSVAQRVVWDLDTAKKAGLYPGHEMAPWRRYTRVMLRWRAASELLRMVCPEAIAGLYVRGEIGDDPTDDEIAAGMSAERRVAA